MAFTTQKHLTSLFEFLKIPSISAQSNHAADIQKAASWLKVKLVELGFSSSILPTKGHPVVYGELLANFNLPTVLVYGHYDVQSPDPLNEWSSGPFEPTVRAGNIYCRGVADDKGQLYTWIAAIEELQLANSMPKVNIKFLIEGEEEVGSKNLSEFVKDNRALLKADVCVISDSHCLSPNQPLIEYGLRGLTYTEVHLKTFPKDVHSGLYGGNVPNPIQILSSMISKLKDDSGKVLVPGFYDNIRRLTKTERKQLNKLPFGKDQVLEETGSLVIFGEPQFTIAERAGARPTLEINGIWGGYQGEGPKTIIPGEAWAKISMRIVPFQNSQEIFEKFKAFIKSLTPKGVLSEVKFISSAEPILLDTKAKYFKYSESAYKSIFGKTPIYGLSGGTIGVVADFKNVLGIDSILMGYGLPDDGLHSPNEKLSLAMFEKGIKTNIEFFKMF